MSLERYKTEMGEYPPDFSELTVNEKRLALNSHLSRKFRLRNINADYTTNVPGDQLTDNDLEQLNPTNALFFWLRGFSKDPQRPLTGAGDRDPFYEFDMTRIKVPATSPPPINTVDLSKPVIAAYAPKGDPQERPYLYYRATPSLPAQTGEPKQAYHDCVVWSKQANAGNVDFLPTGVDQWPTPYLSGVLTRTNLDNSTQPEFVEPEKHQIICAGLDGFYGVGAADLSGVAGIYPEGPYAKNDRDNITSFCSGSTLEDSTP
jgi:hypothetical protein